MTVLFGFYNSVLGDRTYDAMDMGRMFDGVITDGVFESIGEALAVVDSTGMDILVGDGKAWFHNTWTINDADLPLTVEASEITLNRIDTVIIEIDQSPGVRTNSFKIIKGTPAASPGPATLIHTSEVNQYPLAYITVNAGVTSIVPGNISSTIGTGLCPFVTVPMSSGGPVGGGAAVLETQVFS